VGGFLGAVRSGRSSARRPCRGRRTTALARSQAASVAARRAYLFASVGSPAGGAFADAISSVYSRQILTTRTARPQWIRSEFARALGGGG